MKNNKDLIKESLDMSYYGAQLAIICGVAVLVYLFGIILLFVDTFKVLPYLVMYTLLILPFIAYYIVKIYNIRKDSEKYILTEGCPYKREPSLGRRVSLMLEIKDCDGETVQVQTNPIFGMSILSDLYFGEHIGQRLQVLYDKESERVVVIKIIES